MKVILSTLAAFPFHGHGGIEKYPYYLGKYLIKEGIDVEIITSLDRGNKRVEIYDGIKYTFISPMCYWRRLMGPWGYMFYFNVNNYLTKQKFDVLHGYSATPYFYLHHKNRAPTIVQPFGMEMFTAPAIKERRGFEKIYMDIFGRHPWRFCITHADKIASEGDFQIDEIVNLFGVEKRKIFNLPLGVDLSFIDERRQEKKKLRSDLGLADSDFVLISVNRFCQDKGHDDLVESFKYIKQNLEQARLILIGGMEKESERILYQRILDQINSYDTSVRDSIITLTNVPEPVLYDYYAASDIYVSPTLHEDFIMSILESMAFELPVVSTGQEFVVKSGVNGYVVPKRDPRAIADAVLELYDKNKCKQMGKESRKIVEAYDWKNIATKAVREYEELMSK